jgi:hypothetical protein
MDLYWKSVRSHYINPLNKQEEYSTIGTPQGGTLSPILSNIYLHELDKYMENLTEESKKSGKTTTPNPAYRKIHIKISNLRQYFSPNYRYKKTLNKEQEDERLKEILKLEKERAKLNSVVPGPGYRIYYVRYADDFLIGITGKRSLAVEIRDQVKNFLESKLKLNLNMEKTKITPSTEGVEFLGAKIKKLVSRTSDQKRRSNSKTSTGRKVRARTPQGNIRAFAPLDRIVTRLSEQGMCRIVDLNKRAVIPKRKTAWVNLNAVEIINKYNRL